MKKAKVFISCGQNKKTDEVTIAKKIAKKLEDLGYDPYIAVEEQTLSGVKENIFRQLESSEYFLFIDFKREKIGDTGERRGSLFSHQELAIASFLDIDLLAFQEKGVRELDGLIGFLQANAIQCKNRCELPEKVEEKVLSDTNWQPDWKNELKIEVARPPFTSAQISPNDMARFFHISVHNHSIRKHAVNVYAYLKSVVCVSNGQPIPVETAESKWTGYTQPNAVIASKSYRDFDGFMVVYSDPQKVLFPRHTDSSRHCPQVEGPGIFDFTYLVISEKFPAVEESFRVKIGEYIDDIQIQKIS